MSYKQIKKNNTLKLIIYTLCHKNIKSDNTHVRSLSAGLPGEPFEGKKGDISSVGQEDIQSLLSILN